MELGGGLATCPECQGKRLWIRGGSPDLEAIMLAPNALVTKLTQLKLLSRYEQRHHRTLQTTM